MVANHAHRSLLEACKRPPFKRHVVTQRYYDQAEDPSVKSSEMLTKKVFLQVNNNTNHL